MCGGARAERLGLGRMGRPSGHGQQFHGDGQAPIVLGENLLVGVHRRQQRGAAGHGLALFGNGVGFSHAAQVGHQPHGIAIGQGYIIAVGHRQGKSGPLQ